MREELKTHKKLNNKGFSLIELIIVIAIMAILIGIVGTQVMPYIQKSKEAKDKQILSSILTNATSAFATCADDCDVPTTGTQTITITTSGIQTVTDTDLQKVCETLAELTGYAYSATTGSEGPEFSSKKATSSNGVVTISRDSSGKVTVYLGASGSEAFDPISSN